MRVPKFFAAVPAAFVACAVIASCAPGAARTSSTRTAAPAKEVAFFYFEPCASCDGYRAARDLRGEVAKLARTPGWKGDSWDLGSAEARKELERLEAAGGLGGASAKPPLAIVDGRGHNGYEAIRAAVEAAARESAAPAAGN